MMVTLKPLNMLTATEAISEIKGGKITATELMESCIKRIQEIEHKIKAWVYFDKEKALIQSKIVDKKINEGISTGLLNGVPVGVKDIFNTADMPTCMGSPVWDGFTPGNDARAVAYIRWADGVVAGKTVTSEFAVHYPGSTVNPNDYEHTPGTSSSGSAAAVASYMIPLAIGTQTAGSTIRPASYCGIYGFKPSFGLIPRTGMLKTLDTLDHVSFFSRSIDDLHLLLNVLRVKGSNYPYVHKYLDNSSGIKQVNDYPWKVAFVKTPVWCHAEEYAKDSIIDFVSKIDKCDGINLEEIELSEDFNLAHDVHEQIYSKALSYYYKEEYENHIDKISDMFKEMVEKGRRVSYDEYMKGLEKQNLFIHQLDYFFDKNEYDAIITLSTAGDAPRGLYTREKKDSCLIWTLCHVPAINLPVFKSPKGLPFGAQIVARQYRDYNLLNFARYLNRKGIIKLWNEEKVNSGEVLSIH